jgi:hypothetical protein
MRKSLLQLTVGTVVLLAAVATSFGQPADKPVVWLGQLSEQIWNAPENGSVILPTGDRPFVIVAFRTCCPSNKMALKWAAEMKSKWNDSLGVLAFAVENPRQAKKVLSWAKPLNLNFPVSVPESPDLRSATGVMATPAIILLDRTGKEVTRTEFLTESVLKEFEQILEKQKTVQ